MLFMFFSHYNKSNLTKMFDNTILSVTLITSYFSSDFNTCQELIFFTILLSFSGLSVYLGCEENYILIDLT